jgi:hypothetical protein
MGAGLRAEGAGAGGGKEFSLARWAQLELGARDRRGAVLLVHGLARPGPFGGGGGLEGVERARLGGLVQHRHTPRAHRLVGYGTGARTVHILRLYAPRFPPGLPASAS